MSEYLNYDTEASWLEAIAGRGLNKRRLTISERGRPRIGNHFIGQTGYAAIMVSAAGTTEITLKAWCPQHVVALSPGSGSGTYTHKVVLPLTQTDLNGGSTLAALAGDTITVRLLFPASANPTIEIRNASAAGTLLLSVAGTGSLFEQTAHLVWNGAAWELDRTGVDAHAGGAYTTVADAAARHALTPHVGDIVLQADTSHRWIACDVALSATDAGWQDLGAKWVPPPLLIATYVSDISGWTVAGGSAAFTLVGSDVFLSDAANATAIVIASGLNSGGTSVFDFTACANVTSFAGDSAMAGGLDLSPFAAMTSLASNALYYCTGLTSLTLPSGLTSLGDYALYYCSGLTSLTLPSGLTSIGAGALTYCSGLGSLTLPSGLTSLGDYALYYCTGLTSLACLAPAAPTAGTTAFAAITTTDIHVLTTATGYGSTYSGLTVIADL